MLIKSEELREQIKQACKSKGWGHTDLARAAGITYDDVRTFINGRVLKPNYFSVNAMMQALDLENPTPTAPYAGSVSGGVATEPWADSEARQIPVSKYVRDGYVLRLDGDSMNKRIPDGSLMLIDPHAVDFDKKILIMCIDGATTCKYYDASTNEAIPLSYNPTHKNTNLNKHNFQILGRVVQWFDML